jgi:hypothetical protein
MAQPLGIDPSHERCGAAAPDPHDPRRVARLRYLDGSAAWPLQTVQDFGYNPDGLSQ